MKPYHVDQKCHSFKLCLFETLPINHRGKLFAASVGVALIEAASPPIQRLAATIESIVVGAYNLFHCPFSEEYRGDALLSLKALGCNIVLLTFSPIEGIVTAVADIIGINFYTNGYVPFRTDGEKNETQDLWNYFGHRQYAHYYESVMHGGSGHPLDKSHLLVNN